MTNHQSAKNSDGGVPNPAVSEKDRDKFKRHRAGFALLIAGVLLILFAWGSWYYRISNPDEVPVMKIRHD